MMHHLRRWLRHNLTLNKTLLILLAVAIILGLAAYIDVYYGGGAYIAESPLPTSTVAFTTSTVSSTSSSTLGSASTTASGTLINGTGTFSLAGNGSTSSSTFNSSTLARYTSTYATPPFSWKEGYDTIAITGADISGSQLTLTLDIQMGSTAECVPLNLRFVANEQGNLEAPLENAFTFGENGTCIGAPNANYPGQKVVFTIDPSVMPLVLTTGGTSNEYFELKTTASGTISIYPPPTRG